MILRLAWDELVRRRGDVMVAFICSLPMAVILSLTWGSVGFHMTAPIAVTFASTAYCQRTAYKDDKAGMLLFLRAMPIGPSQLIFIRALASTAVVITNSALAPLVTLLVVRFSSDHVPRISWMETVAWSIALGMVLMAFCNAWS